MELWIGRTPLLLHYNNCNEVNLLLWLHFFKLQKEAHMGHYPYMWFAQVKECSKPLNISFAKRKQNLCLQHLVVLPLLCCLVHHHQPPRMAACTTICTTTRSGHGTKGSKLGHIPRSNYNGERKLQGKKTIPKIKRWDDRGIHICASKYPWNQLSVIQFCTLFIQPILMGE